MTRRMPRADTALWIDLDLTEAARGGRLAPAFACEPTLRLLADAISSSHPRSPVLVGASGVGKTAILHELIRRAVAGEGPAVLRDHRVVQLSLTNIAARFKDRQAAANFAGQLFDAFAAEGEVVVIRDVHAAYALDWEPVLFRYLSTSGLPLLGEGQAQPVEQMVEYSSDLAAHLVTLPVVQPDLPTVRRIVEEWCAWHGREGGRTVTPEAQRLAIELTGRFRGDRPFPRKALDLLACARDLATPAPDGTVLVTEADVLRRFSETTRVPTHLVDPAVPLDLTELRRFVEQRLLGQEEAADAVVRVVSLLKAGLADLSRPLGVFLFVGPTGVGKTHTAQLLAEYLFGDRERVIRLNLTDFAAENAVAELFGYPHAPDPGARAGVLTTRLRGHAFGVLLLDEFEKAHPRVFDSFMQLFDEGRFVNGAGDTVSLTSLIVIATSNAGAEVYREHRPGFHGEPDVRALDQELDRRLHRTFKVELLNRFDRVVHFHPLDRTHIRAIATRELGLLVQRSGVQSRGLRVEVEPELVEWLAAHGYHPHYGARFLRRELERNVTAALAEAIVRERPAAGARVALGVRGDRVQVRVYAPAPPVAEVRLPSTEGEKTRQLDRRALYAEARTWVERWAPLFREHAERREQASRLVEASMAPAFWSDPAQAEATLRRYKALDARLQADERLLLPARNLQDLLERNPALPDLARQVEAAARAWREWTDLGLAEGPDTAWVVVRSGDAMHPSPSFIADLVGCYRAWFPRRGLDVGVVAEQVENGKVVAAALEVDGAGAWQVASMEHGRHRRRLGEVVERARVEVLVPRGDTPAPPVHDARRVRGTLLAHRSARVTLAVPGRGIRETWFGSDRATLARLAGDLAASLAAPPGEPELVRTYGLTGGVVQDPRTGAAHPSARDVLKGDLQVFFDAWRSR